jgi:diguanylate cyclase (GGDEF)-like protein/PAS domain S-box-containing protein
MSNRQLLSGRAARLARGSRERVLTAVIAVLVVLAMVAGAVFSRQTADLHRRAQVLAEQIHSTADELEAFKWEANTRVLSHTADFSLGSQFVRRGLALMHKLFDQVNALHRLQPGGDTDKLRSDVNRLFSSSLNLLSVARSSRFRTSLAWMENQFQPPLDRLDHDAVRAAEHQRAVAGGALELAWVGSIGSLLLGLGALSILGWRMTRLHRHTELAEEVRAVERRSEARLRALLERSSDVATVLDRDLRVRWLAASIRRLLGCVPESLIGEPIVSLVHPADRESFEAFLRATADGTASSASSALRARMRHTDGHWCHVETVAEDLFADPAVEGLVLNMRDISERKAFEDELRHQAFHDALTGLANRALFEDRLSHALASTLRTRKGFAVLFLDLDDFKTINDSFGHRAGDALLQGVAARIDSLVRPTDTAARLGGDEFALLFDGVDTRTEAEAMGTRLLDALSERFTIDGREVGATVSIGIALSEGSVRAEEVLRNADMAMYAAKAAGKNAVRTFELTMRRRAVERLELRGELHQAVALDEFLLEYQPIVSLPTGEAVGIEALVCWQHPNRGQLAPGEFIGLAEETGLIVPVGSWILEQVCGALREWQLALPGRPLHVSVNVSIRQLHEEDFPATVASVLERTALDPHALVLEIAESRLAEDREAIVRRLEALKRLGVRIAIDDFGGGHSALSDLHELPVDIVKIDRSFIGDLEGESLGPGVVRTVLSLGESLGLDVIPEGVERLDQAERLIAMRATLAQGFLFARPLAPEAVLDVLRAPDGLLPRTVP